MDKNMLNRLFIISSLGLLIAGAVFLCISILRGNNTTTPLAIALGCVLSSNVFNIVRQMNNKEK